MTSMHEVGEAPTVRRSRLAEIQSSIGNQGMLRRLHSPATDFSSNAPAGLLQRKCACGGSGGDCAECKKKEGELQRKTAKPAADGGSGVPPIVHDVLRSPGQPLDRGTRTFMESRFGHDFSGVRVHTDAKAARSANAVNALAYTVGRDVVFASNEYSPASQPGKQLLAHELAHVAQQRADASLPQKIGPENDGFEREADAAARQVADGGPSMVAMRKDSSGAVQRTPARKVSCASGPLHLPDGSVIDDPVAVITAAEDRAGELLDEAIGELDFTRRQILGGATIGFPVISDALAFGMRLIGLDAGSERVWKQVGGPANYTAELLLRRLRMIRKTIGSGDFFFVCLGPQNGTIGKCVGPICSAGNAGSCDGSFQIDFCPRFWMSDAESQAGTLIHESSHNFAEFIGDDVHRGSGVAACYTRFAQVVGGSNIPNQRVDLCPDPT
jgi:hypothetical protein